MMAEWSGNIMHNSGATLVSDCGGWRVELRRYDSGLDGKWINHAIKKAWVIDLYRVDPFQDEPPMLSAIIIRSSATQAKRDAGKLIDSLIPHKTGQLTGGDDD